MNRIFIVDNHPVIVRAYARRVEDAQDLSVCGTATSFSEALEAIPKTRPDLAIVDVDLGRDAAADGIDLVRRLSTAMKADAPRWLVVSVHEGSSIARCVREAGGDQFLPKRGGGSALLESIYELVGAPEA